ncbi:60 kDa lysophospholipase isoform X1 [Otolemur garnettii]|uniref:60 kDa lysophospholipase isoform X1 n=2 Tax=Otolemur garnettii TaxID=30611 RepID=UPI000C7F4CAB|nr:60 kDa lysophospholipase isoform X1 [Otolemur garnettii]
MARAMEPERRLLAIYTGGTIGMRSEGGVLVPGRGLAAALRMLPMFHDEEHAQACGLPEDTLVLPPASPGQRIIYTVLECQPLFDSSDMTITEWVQIAQTIEKHYKQYHGFVVIHGTDTMAFAAAVLSFVLENLQKTVILTGAQVPIHALWSDGRENLLGALLMAGQYEIPEVCLFFQNQLFRGNRTTKVDARRFAAFCSPNLPPLATVGADVTINRDLVRKVGRKAQLVVRDSVEPAVGLLRLYPGISASLVRAFLQPPMKGLVMETFGSGNGPTKPDVLQELRVAAERGLVIVNCTHCLQGAVTSDYAAGMAMAGAGIISGFDMTSEAALAKLSYVLGQPGLSLDDRKELLAKDLRGELTLPTADEPQPSLCGSPLDQRVAWLLGLSGSQEADAVRDTLMPSLACAAAHAGDLEALQVLADLGSDLSLEDFHGQTPLHTAAKGGHARVVAMLLQRGVDVNSRDQDGLSPLLLAVRGRHQGVIKLLRAAGACLSTEELEDAGTELCRLAFREDTDGLRAWCQAGVDLGQPGYDGHSALRVAEAAGHLEVVSLLHSLASGVTAEAPGPVSSHLGEADICPQLPCDGPDLSTGGTQPGSRCFHGTPWPACPSRPSGLGASTCLSDQATSWHPHPLLHCLTLPSPKDGWVCSGLAWAFM